MKQLSLDQIFHLVKDCLGQFQQSHAWTAEKIGTKNIIVIQKVVSKTFSAQEAEQSQTPRLPIIKPSNKSRAERPKIIKIEEEPWTEYLAFHVLGESGTKTELENTSENDADEGDRGRGLNGGGGSGDDQEENKGRARDAKKIGMKWPSSGKLDLNGGESMSQEGEYPDEDGDDIYWEGEEERLDAAEDGHDVKEEYWDEESNEEEREKDDDDDEPDVVNEYRTKGGWNGKNVSKNRVGDESKGNEGEDDNVGGNGSYREIDGPGDGLDGLEGRLDGEGDGSDEGAVVSNAGRDRLGGGGDGSDEEGLNGEDDRSDGVKDRRDGASRSISNVKGEVDNFDQRKTFEKDVSARDRVKPRRRSYSLLALIKPSEDGRFSCPKCPLSFEFRDSLGTHFGKMHGDHFECPVCHVKFKTRSTMRFHREMIHNDGTGHLQCHLCDMRFHYKCYLQRHKSTCHGKGLDCERCKARFRTLPELKKHKLVEHESDVFRCGVCPETFLAMKELKYHLNKTHPDASPMNVCDHCQKSFSAEQELSYHIDEFHEDESKSLEKPFACPVDLCKKRFRLEFSLAQHASLHSTTTRILAKRKSKKALEEGGTLNESPCPSCGKMFEAQSMTFHLKSCGSRPSFKCPHCEKSFSHKPYLKIHQISKHLKIKYPCPIEGCGKFLTTRYLLNSHIKLVHESNVRYQCRQCEKSFKIHHDLKQHIKAVHEGKKVQCSFCERDFGRPSDKNRHERQVHGSIKSVNARN